MLLGDHNTFKSIVRYLHKLLIATSTSHRQSKLHLRKLVLSIPLKLCLSFAEKKKIKRNEIVTSKIIVKAAGVKRKIQGKVNTRLCDKNQGGSSWLGATGFSVHRKTKFESFLR